MSLHSRRGSQRQQVLEIWYTGNGSDTFDPAIITSQSTTVIWQTSDGQRAVTTGITHDFSYTPANGGPYQCTVRCAMGLSAIVSLSCATDSVIKIKNVKRCTMTDASSGLVLAVNADLVFDLGDLPRKTARFYAGQTVAPAPGIRGNLSDIPPDCGRVSLTLDTGILPGNGIGHITGLRIMSIISMGWNQSQVDAVIASAWSARTNYISSSISLSIGGTNAAPSGNLIAPEEGSDWHNDGAKWIPLTGKAMVYDLLNDVNSEGFKKWATISTS